MPAAQESGHELAKEPWTTGNKKAGVGRTPIGLVLAVPLAFRLLLD